MNIRWFCNQLLQGLMLPSSADLSQMYPENVMKLITIKSEEQKLRCIAKKHLISILFYHFCKVTIHVLNENKHQRLVFQRRSR